MPDLSADRPLPLPNEGYTEDDLALVGDAVGSRALARIALRVLGAAGRLLPPDADRAEEWTMRYSLNGGPLQIGEEGGHVLDDLEDCQRHIRVWREHYPDLAYSDVSYLRRDVFTGPWVEVDPHDL